MSDSEAAGGEAPESRAADPGHNQPGCGCQAAMRAAEGISRAIQRVCPCAGKVEASAERLRGSIRAQPLVAVLVALGAGVLLGHLTGSAGRPGGRP